LPDVVEYAIITIKENAHLDGDLLMPDEFGEALKAVHESAFHRILFLPHALSQMNALTA
jgi:hypothetical protein